MDGKLLVLERGAVLVVQPAKLLQHLRVVRGFLNDMLVRLSCAHMLGGVRTRQFGRAPMNETAYVRRAAARTRVRSGTRCARVREGWVGSRRMQSKVVQVGRAGGQGGGEGA